MSLWSAAALLSGAGGILLLAAVARALRRGRVLRAAMAGTGAVSLLAAGALLLMLGSSLYVYRRLTAERPVAQLLCIRLAPQHYRVWLNPTGGVRRAYDLRGDQWRLDARILTWRGPARLLGFGTRYRLDRIAGRYARVREARSRPPSVYRVGTAPTPDLWSLAHRYRRWLPWVDAYYGSAVYAPLAQGARYSVSVTGSGLVARPENAAARRALSGLSG